MKNKEFDAVEIMREIRNKLSKKYSQDPEAENRDLKRVRRKYNIKEMAMNNPVNKL
jgi:hypothetical protein